MLVPGRVFQQGVPPRTSASNAKSKTHHDGGSCAELIAGLALSQVTRPAPRRRGFRRPSGRFGCGLSSPVVGPGPVPVIRPRKTVARSAVRIVSRVDITIFGNTKLGSGGYSVELSRGVSDTSRRMSAKECKLPLSLILADELIEVRQNLRGGNAGAPQRLVDGQHEGSALNRVCVVMLSSALQALRVAKQSSRRVGCY